jgi:signal peptidase II
MSDEAHTPEPSHEGAPTSPGAPEPGSPDSAAPPPEAVTELSAAAVADTTAATIPATIPEPSAEVIVAPPDAVVAPLAPVVAPPKYRPSYVFLGVVALISLVLDLGSKAWAKGHLEDAKSFADRHIEVIPKFLALTFARNKGGAWGLLQDESEAVRRPFFFSISLLAVLFIVSLYRRLTPDQTALKWGLPLVLGGALGNLVNRIQYNYVVDFIDVYGKWGGETHHWPTFNVADIAIVLGVGLMAIDMFTSRKPKAASPAASAEEAHRAP